MAERSPVFDKITQDYLRQVSALENLGRICEALGATHREDTCQVPYFNRRFTIGADGIFDETGAEPHHATSVILCKYLLLCPDHPDNDQNLVTYKDFKDAAPYVIGFRNTAENIIARQFEGKLEILHQKCLALGGRLFQTEVSCQLAFRFDALPKVPVILLFNDADEEFGSQCTLLFQKNAATYLDMECLAMVGSTLAAWL